MNDSEYFAIGLMSGTSLDGLDICYVRFSHTAAWSFEIICCETIPYSAEWEERLKNAIHIPSQDLLKLNVDFGFYLGEVTKTFIEKHGITKLDLIASHGHTIFHQPEKGFTLQIGDGRAIRSKTDKTVVYDFRSQDVLLGGNGAPLVPIGDELLFSGYDACLNLGGFSNISMNREGKRLAFDICPVNIVLNDWAMRLGRKFDDEGALARSGNTNPHLLERLNNIAYYHQPAPKSLGIEWVNSEIKSLIAIEKPEDALATLTAHAAIQIADVLNRYHIQNVLITGGGAYNRFLIESVQNLTNTQIKIPNRTIIEYKEALIFAFMGVLRSRNLINVLSSATGSVRDHSSGLICN